MDTVLVVDDEHNLLEVLAVALENMGHEVLTADSGERGLEILAGQEVQLVISDLRLPGLNGRELLDKVRRLNPGPPVIIMTAYASVKDAVELIKEGAFDYIAKPFDLEALEATVAGALRFAHLSKDNRNLRQALGKEFSSAQLIGDSPAMQAVRRSIADVSASNSTVLILGESGTGKELAAKAIHYNGPRASAPLICVNCAAIPEALLESELFGHVKGAFTGAVAARVGRFSQAHLGSLFLDEIGDMPLFLQAKILRAIQEKSIEPVGASAPRQVDARIIAATNRNLPEAVAQGAFRQDLYYRLNVFPLLMPPLRERREDIPRLINHFAARIADKMGRTPLRFSAGAIQTLQDYSWPGNVRELENCIERLAIVTPGGMVDRDGLLSFAPAARPATFGPVGEISPPVLPPPARREGPEEPGRPGEPKEPREPGKPGEPKKPGEPGRPGEPKWPGEPEEPGEPGKLGKPEEPKEPKEPDSTPIRMDFPLDLPQALEDLERRLLLEALEESSGVQVKAAELLGISERSIWHRIKKLGIQIKKEAL